MRLYKSNILRLACICLLASLLLYICNTALTQNSASSERSRAAISNVKSGLIKALSEKDLKYGSAVFFRIVKTQNGTFSDGYLEAFVENEVGRFQPFKRWDICTYSGDLGPKLAQGDGQSPEGFYYIKPSSLNPYSSYHLSFNLGYPNAYDRYHGRTGDYLMVHGDCVSVGCYAMGDEQIEEIYTLTSAAFEAGQSFIRVHIFPFEMDDGTLRGFAENPNYEFWKNLKSGWDWYETKGRAPNVTVDAGRYVFSD